MGIGGTLRLGSGSRVGNSERKVVNPWVGERQLLPFDVPLGPHDVKVEKFWWAPRGTVGPKKDKIGHGQAASGKGAAAMGVKLSWSEGGRRKK